MVEVAQKTRTAERQPAELEAQGVEARARAGQPDAQVELASRLEAQGRFEEALDWLSKAGQQGHAGALTRLGMKLITGGAAPYLPVQGAGLLLNAAHLGGAEAAARLAVLAGIGVYGPQSWTAALDLLQRAAELGWRNAQIELAILSDAPEFAAQAWADGPYPEDLWSRLRQRVDLAAWITPPAAEALLADPLVRRFRGFAPLAACDWLIEQARGRLVPAQLYDDHSGAATQNDYRSNSAANFGLLDTSLVLVLLQARLAAALNTSMTMLEAANVLHYAVGEKFDEHHDYIDPRSPSYARLIAQGGQRTATCIIYLNDDYEGGETEFTRLGLSHKGARGEAVVFLNTLPDGTPDPRSAHAGRPPLKGEKWIVVNFTRDRPQLPQGPEGADRLARR